MWFHADTYSLFVCFFLLQFFQSPHASLRKLALGCINQYIVVMPSVGVLPHLQLIFLSSLDWLFGTLDPHRHSTCPWISIFRDYSTLQRTLQQMSGNWYSPQTITYNYASLLVRELHIMARYLFARELDWNAYKMLLLHNWSRIFFRLLADLSTRFMIVQLHIWSWTLPVSFGRFVPPGFSSLKCGHQFWRYIKSAAY